MARRGRRQRVQIPVPPDGLDAPEVQAELNANRRSGLLPNFDSVARAIKTMRINRVTGLQALFAKRLKELEIEPGGRGVRGVPEGSDQIGLGSVASWVNSINKDNADAVEQLKRLHATAANRVRG